MASTNSDDAGGATNARRPSLSISTAPSEPSNEEHSAGAAPHLSAEAKSPGSSDRASSGGGAGGAGSAGGQQRNFSAHTRSQSLAEHHHHASPTSPPSAGNETGVAGQGGHSDLVRRHHTLSSTSSSRLVRLERSRARLALQGVGLSEEDQDFYIPPSPVRAGPVGGWSDAGHGSSTSSYAPLPAQRHSLAVVGESHSRSASNSSAWEGSDGASLDSSSVGRGEGSQQAEPGHDQQSAQSLPPAAAKRSSFVVLRGAKGDAALTQRRSEQPLQQQEYQAPPPRVDSLHSMDVPSMGISPPKGLKHKNSLKPFLEAEAHSAGGEEEWERSLKDERNKEEMQLRRGEEDSYLREPYATTPPLGSTQFGAHETSPFSHSRANTYQQPGANSDPWSAGEDASLRRHASLNSFRPSSDVNGDTMSSSALDGGWGTAHTRLASSEEILGSLALNSVGFGRSRSGTTPAPLSLGQSSHGTNTPHSASGLSHSNSLSSHSHSGLSHSNSLNAHDRGALSPVGFPRSPWSPTYEETKQLGMGSVVAGTPPTGMSLNRGGSGSSRGSRISEEVGRLGDDMSQLEIGNDSRQMGGSSSTPPRLERRASDRENSVSPRPPSRGVGRSLSGNAPPSTRNRLPPLLTNLDTLQQQPQQPLNAAAHTAAFLSRQGPASASAFVPPIGHSHLPSASSSQAATPQAQTSFLPSIAEPNQQTPRGNFTAVPGASSSDWHRQKEMLIGAAAGASAFPSAVGVNPTGEAWPAGGGFGVGIAIQQQQQIQVLQNQMQQALSAMEVMRNQGAQIPAGFNASGLGPMPNGLGPAAGAYGMQGAGVGASLTPPPPIGVAQTQAQAGAVDSPIDIPSLIANKGYNPTNFDLRPANVRFFVIKSYTEEDVHKSLKYEIWASTDLGNKRLDRAFRESADKGPIYLFFSVNASGHFAGMAQMLTPVDYQTSSNVWASDKWKGVLKVRWIFIKDVPLASLRHIRLSNTPENKPVTSSRDTQEVPYDAGLEVLRILSSYQSRTSLLQDLPWYEAKLSQTGDAKEEGEEAARPSHYARPSASPQPGHQPHYAPRPQSHSPAPQFRPPPAHYQQRQQQQQQQQQPYLAQPQYGMPLPGGPMPMGVGLPPHFGQQMAMPLPLQQQMPPQMPPQQQQQQQGGRRFYNRGAAGGPQVF